MHNINKNLKRWVFLSLLVTLVVTACNTVQDRLDNFQQVNLVANNGSYVAGRIDPNFSGAWGFDFSPFGPAFISSHGNGTSVVYGTAGDERRDPVIIPGPGEIPAIGQPSGVVFNGTNTFFLADFAPARFIYAGTDGIISAWNVDNNAEVVADNSATASYTGIAIGQDAGIDLLYVANFKEARIQVYDGAFSEVSRPFTDPNIPSGYSPYNIRNIDGKLYVTYAKMAANGSAETGAGKGYVDIYNTDGSLSKRFVSGGKLNAPWGIVKVTPEFSTSTTATVNSILVGNYGDGRLNAYSQAGNFQGAISTPSAAISIQGLRNISFAPDSVVAEHGKLFFTAAPNGGQDALFGYVNEVQP
jgi:uncharacterized protein (TIGR03118 family)